MAALRESRSTAYRLSTASRTWGTVGELAEALVGSVLARGRLSEVSGTELAQLGSQIPMPFTAGHGEAHIIRLTPRSVSGRHIPLPADVPPGWYRETILDSHLFVEDP